MQGKRFHFLNLLFYVFSGLIIQSFFSKLFQKLVYLILAVPPDVRIVLQVSGELRNDISIRVNLRITDYSPIFTRLIIISFMTIVHHPCGKHVL